MRFLSIRAQWPFQNSFKPKILPHINQLQIKVFMKKGKLFMSLLVAVFLVSAAANAQSVKGNNYLNAGIGLGTYGFSGTGGLPITASFEHGFSDKISAGVFFGTIQRKYADDWKYKYTVIGVRGSYHFNELLNVSNEKLDVYGGVSLSRRGYTLKYEWSDGEHTEKEKVTAGDMVFGIHAAARYMFSNNIGGYAEVGYGISPLQLGLAFKF